VSRLTHRLALKVHRFEQNNPPRLLDRLRKSCVTSRFPLTLEDQIDSDNRHLVGDKTVDQIGMDIPWPVPDLVCKLQPFSRSSIKTNDHDISRRFDRPTKCKEPAQTNALFERRAEWTPGKRNADHGGRQPDPTCPDKLPSRSAPQAQQETAPIRSYSSYEKSLSQAPLLPMNWFT